MNTVIMKLVIALSLLLIVGWMLYTAYLIQYNGVNPFQ